MLGFIWLVPSHFRLHLIFPTLQANLHIQNLFEDLHDGKALMRLLEVISGESVGRPNHGKLRVQKMENINKALKFLSSKVSQDCQLESVKLSLLDIDRD